MMTVNRATGKRQQPPAQQIQLSNDNRLIDGKMQSVQEQATMKVLLGLDVVDDTEKPF